MRTRFSLAFALAALLPVLASCVAKRTEAPALAGSGPQLLIAADFDAVSEKTPVGWIYAFDDAAGRKNRCVYVWSDSTWSLAEETQPGFYGDWLGTSCIGSQTHGSLRPALDFPADALDGWQRVYIAGGIEAVYKGRAIARKG